MPKLEALQAALGQYFNRFPRVSAKALAMRSAVPYATLRRIIQSEVEVVKDETVFKLIERIMPLAEQMEFIQRYYPSLGRIVHQASQTNQENAELLSRQRTFQRMYPHNRFLQLAQMRHGLRRGDALRLCGELGLDSLDEMLEAGILHEEDGIIRSRLQGATRDLSDLLHQTRQDLGYVPIDGNCEFSLIGHVSESIQAEDLASLVGMGDRILKEIAAIQQQESGRVPFFLDIVIGPYDARSLFEDG